LQPDYNSCGGYEAKEDTSIGGGHVVAGMKKRLLLAFLLVFTFLAFVQYESVAGVSAGLSAGAGRPQ
jgi:hypothetical protein